MDKLAVKDRSPMDAPNSIPSDDSSKRKRPPLNVTRDLILLSVPIAYVLGFLTWAVYATEAGLGFLALSIPQYLMVGYMTGFMLLAVVSPWIIFHLARLPVLARAGAAALGGATPIFALRLVGEYLGAFQLPLTRLLALAGLSILAVVFAVAVGLANRSKAKEHPPHAEFTVGTVVVCLILIVSNGLELLPTIPDTFGGAEPRSDFGP